MLLYGYNVTKNRQNSRKAKSSKDSYALDITPAVITVYLQRSVKKVKLQTNNQ